MTRCALAVFAVGLALAGCGSNGQDEAVQSAVNAANADKAAMFVRADVHATGAGSCEWVRTATVNGRVMTLYSCTMRGVPEWYRLAGSFEDPTQHYCYAFADDAGVMLPELSPRCEKD